MFPTPEERRHKRCFHRVISGLERGGSFRLLTLTSSDRAPSRIQPSFRKLIMRLRRRRLVQDYIKVIETKDDWRKHIHMCFRGDYIDQAYLSHLWQQIHNSPVVDIRKVRYGSKSRTRVASYLAKYMAKEVFHRYSWSWGWVYKGFVATWRLAMQIVRPLLNDPHRPTTFQAFLRLWHHHIRAPTSPFFFLAGLKTLAFVRARLHSEPVPYQPPLTSAP